MEPRSGGQGQPARSANPRRADTTERPSWDAMDVGNVRVVYRFDGLVLDLVRGALFTASGEEMPLRRKSFDLLRLFVENAGRLLDRDSINKAIWPEVTVTDDGITQCVRDIRRALGDRAHVKIRTVPRRGYILAAEVTSAPDLAGPEAAVVGAREKPSVAVLAFDNLSGDPEQEYFSDGIAEDITTALSRTRSLFVTSRNSSFTYKGGPVDVKRVAREMGVRYVVEGSVQRAGTRVRITAQLIDAETGGHMWAEHYDRVLIDTFAVRDEITTAVATAIVPAISKEELRRTMLKPPEDLNAWESWQRALWHWSKGGDFAARREFLQQTIAQDSRFPPAHALMARIHLSESTRGVGRPLRETIKLAEAEARIALDLDPESAIAHTALAWVLDHRGESGAALEEAEIALALNPNDPEGYLIKGHILGLSGRPVEARRALDVALRLDPYGPTAPAAMHNFAVNSYLERNYSEAERIGRRAIRAYPEFPRPHLWLAAALGQLGRTDEARSALDMAIAKSPSYFNYKTRSRAPYMRLPDHECLLEGLRKAGWDGTSAP